MATEGIGRPRPVPPPAPPKPPAPMPVAEPILAGTDFRKIGDVPLALWERELRDAGSPIFTDTQACWQAVQGYSLLALYVALRESSFGASSQARTTKNALGLMIPNAATPMTFETWADGFAEFRRRVDSREWKGGIYPEGCTFERYTVTYVGGPGCWTSGGRTCANGETWSSSGGDGSINRYIRQGLAKINAWRAQAQILTNPVPMPDPSPGTTVTGKVVLPDRYEARLIAGKENWAFSRDGVRQPRGIVLHRMLGTLVGTDTYFRNEARNRALTDFGVGDGGRVFQWTPLWGELAPWASGPANGVKGDATPFVAKYGIAAVNRDCASIEVAGYYDTPIGAEDYRALIQTLGWVVDAWWKQTWDKWPRNRDGLHGLFWHSEFTSDKPCPGPALKNLTGQIIEDVRSYLKSKQQE